MTHSRSIHRRVASAALLIAAAAVPLACRQPSSHHAVGAAEVPSVAPAQHGDHGHPPAQAAKTEFQGDPYLLDIDPVSGEKLGAVDKLVTIDHEGRELRFASEKNVTAFRAEPAKYLGRSTRRSSSNSCPSILSRPARCPARSSAGWASR